LNDSADATSLIARRGVLGFGLAAAGCAAFRPPTRVPMDVTRMPATSERGAGTLLVMLPGAYSRVSEFVDEGMIDAARAAGVDAAIDIVDAHLGYFVERSVLERLREDIVRPAREQGVRQVWLLGISLGGLGALGYAVTRPREVDGVVALAPYLGTRMLLKEIEAAGGARAWAASPQTQSAIVQSEELEIERKLWQALAAPTPASLPPIWLGYGDGDRFAPAHRLLAPTLPPQRVNHVPGGHDWAAWRTLWQQWLALGVLRAAPA
jgi:pimeloyl-ACP methyl ester carboxylesterase